MSAPIHVLALFAHPDDAEFLCAGTLTHLSHLGARVVIATMTAGDCGSTILPAPKITKIRRGEATRAARLIHADYICLGEKDLLIMYDRLTLRRVMELVRRVDPSLVFTHSPVDYMVDHETTSRLCQTACFGAMAPNFRTHTRRAAKVTRTVPHLYYAQPFGGRDIYGQEFPASLFVDITATLDQKEAMLACHESQGAFLRAQQGISSTLDMLQQMARRAGEISGFSSAEGFRPHRGQGFPQKNPLGELLAELVKTFPN